MFSEITVFELAYCVLAWNKVFGRVGLKYHPMHLISALALTGTNFVSNKALCWLFNHAVSMLVTLFKIDGQIVCVCIWPIHDLSTKLYNEQMKLKTDDWQRKLEILTFLSEELIDFQFVKKKTDGYNPSKSVKVYILNSLHVSLLFELIFYHFS